LAKYQAEAEGIRQVLDSKAAGYESLVNSCNGDAKSAATLLMIEKIEDIVAKQVEAIQNLKIDKITVWDSGGNGEGTSTTNFISNMIKAIPPLQDVAGMAGIELPDYLGRMQRPGRQVRSNPGNNPNRPTHAANTTGTGTSRRLTGLKI